MSRSGRDLIDLAELAALVPVLAQSLQLLEQLGAAYHPAAGQRPIE